MKYLKLAVSPFLALLMLTSCSGCGGGSVSGRQAPSVRVFTPMEVFALADGQQWDMQDAAGYKTHFYIHKMASPQACTDGEFFAMHLSKTNQESYWHPGTGTLDWGDWVFKKDQGAWNLVTFLTGDDRPEMNGFFNTWQVEAPDGDWQLNPGNISDGQTLTISSDFSYWITNFKDLRSCMTRDQVQYFGQPERMITTERIEEVSTPVYTGPSVSVDYCEIDLPAPPGGDCNRAHEKWWYAPGIGVVQIEIMSSSNPSDGTVGYTTRRIN